MENKTHKKMKTPVRILLLVVLALAVAASGFGIYFAVSDGFGPAEPPVDLVKAEADFRAQMADSSVQEVTLPVDLVLTSPVEVSGNKVITGEGSLTAAKEMKGNYLITVSDGINLTLKGDIKFDAAGISGGVYVAVKGNLTLEGNATVANAAEGTANVKAEGKVQMAGGNLVGGYNNVVLTKGAELTWSAGTNSGSIRSGILVPEGAKLSITGKDATLTGSGLYGIELMGAAVIENGTMSASYDTMIKVAPTGTLEYKGGTMTEAGYHGIENAGTVTVTGGFINKSYNSGIVNTGTLTVTGGTIMNSANKGIMNKLNGKATVGGDAMLSTNQFAISNEDNAYLELSSASVMASVGTNVYAYGGQVYIHDIELSASGSNNVRVVAATVTMKNVTVAGNTASGSSTTHGILLEGGKVDATDVTIHGTKGNGIRNKGGEFIGKNITVQNSANHAVSNRNQDVTDRLGIVTIDNLVVESIRYNNILVEGGITTLTNSVLNQAGTNNIKISDGTVNLTNVQVLGNVDDAADNVHGIYMTGGELNATNIHVENTRGAAFRVNGEAVKVNVNGVTTDKMGMYGVSVSVGDVRFENATFGPSKSNNLRLDKGSMVLANTKILGHYADSASNVHAVYITGGVVNAKNLDIQNPTGAGLRNNGGQLTVDNVTISGVGTHNLYLSSEGNTTITNAVLGKAPTNSISIANGLLTMKDVKIEGHVAGGAQNIHGILADGGTINAENLTVTGTTGSAIRNKGANVTVTGLVVDNFGGYNAISNAFNDNGVDYGNVTVTDLTVSNGVADTKNLVVLDNNCPGTMQITDAKINALSGDQAPQSNVNVHAGTMVLSNVEFGKTFSNSIRIDGGELDMSKVTVAGHVEGSANNVHGVYVPGGKLTAKDLTVSDTTGSGLRNNGGEMNLEKVTVTGAKACSIYNTAEGKTVITDAVLGASGTNNVMHMAGELVLKNVEIQGQLPGGKQNEHGILAGGGKVTAEDLTISGSSGSALRNKGAEVVLKNVTVDGFGGYNAISNAYSDNKKDYGNVSIENMTVINAIGKTNDLILIYNECPGTMTIVDAKLELDADDTIPKSNVNVLDGNVTLRNVTFGKTHSNNVRVDGGLLKLENIVIPGHVEGSPENVHGLYTPGGEVIAKDLTITGTTGAGLRNTAGKVTVENLKIENVGSHTLYISGGETKLTNATIGKTGTNNVALHDGKLTLVNAEILGHVQTAPGDAHAIFVYGGALELDTVTITGTTGSALRVKAGTANAKNLTLDTIGGSAINISGGKTVIDAVSTANVGTNNISIWGDALVQISNAQLCATKTHNVRVETGALVLSNAVIPGHVEGSANNVHAVYVTNGSADIRDIAITNPSGDGLRVDGETGSINGVNVTIEGPGRNGMWVSNGSLSIENGKISGLKGNNNNVLMSGGSVSLTNVELGAVNKHNNLSINGGELKLHDVTVYGNNTTDNTCHNLYANGDSKVTATGYLKLYDAAGAGIRVTDNAVVSATEVTITNSAVYGIRVTNNAELTLDGLEISGVKTNNLLMEGGNVTLKNAVLNETNNNNIKLVGGYLTLESVDVMGQTVGSKTDVHGIFLEGTGVLDAKDILIANTTGQALRVKGSEATVDGLILRNIGAPTLISNTLYKENPGKLTINRLGLSSGCDHAKYVVYSDSDGNQVKLSNSILSVSKNGIGVYVGAGEAELDNVKISGGLYAVQNFASVTVKDSSLFNSIWSLRNEEGAKATLTGSYFYGNKEGTLPSNIFNGGELTISNITVGYNRSGKGTSGVLYQTASASPIVLKGSEMGLHTPSKPVLLAAEEWVERWGVRVPVIICDSVEDAMDVAPSFKQGKTDPYLYISQRDNHLELTTQGADAIQPGGNYIIKIGSIRFESFEEAFAYIAQNAQFDVTGDYKKAATIQVIDSYDHFENVVIPEGFHITLIDDGDALRVITNDTDGDMFTVGKNAMLTIGSTNGKTPVSGLTFDGANKAESAIIHVGGGHVVIKADLTLSNVPYAIRMNGGKLDAVGGAIVNTNNVSNSVYAINGTANDLHIVGTKGNAVYMTDEKADATFNNLTIEGCTTGIQADNGALTINGLTCDAKNYNVFAGTNNASSKSNAVVTINGYTDGSASLLLPAGSNSVGAYYGATVNFNNVEILGHDENLTSNIHGVIITGATVNMDQVVVENTVMAGIRLNDEGSVLNATNTVVRNTGTLGISLGTGKVTLGDGVTLQNTASHGIQVEAKGELNVTGAVVVDTAVGNALHVSGAVNMDGKLDLKNIGGTGLQMGSTSKVTVTGELAMQTVGNRGIAVSGGTLDASAAAKVTIIDAAGVGLETTGNVSVNNLTIDTTLADAVNAHNIKIMAGSLKLSGDTVLGQSNSQNFLVNGTSQPVVDLTGTVTIKGTDSNNALKIDGGIVNLDGQLNIQSAANYALVIYGEADSFTASDHSVLTVDNAVAGIRVENGTVVLGGSVAVNNMSDRGIQVLKGVLDAQNASSVTIVDSLGIGLETNVNTIINNLTIDTTLSNAVNAHNIKVTAGNLTLTGDTKLGQSNSNNFRVENGASAELSGTVSIGGTDSNNSLVINGAVTLAENTKLSVSGSKNNGIYFENGLGSFVAETGSVISVDNVGGSAVVVKGENAVFSAAAGTEFRANGAKGNTVYVSGGTVELDKVILSGGSANAIVSENTVVTDENGVETERYAAKLTINELTVSDWAAAGKYVIHQKSNGNTVIHGGQWNVGEGKAFGYAVNAESGVLQIANVTVGKTNSNVIANYGAALDLVDVTVLGHTAATTSNVHGIILSGGVTTMDRVTVSGTSKSGLRINSANAVAIANDLTVLDAKEHGISMSNGSLTLSGTTTLGDKDDTNGTIAQIGIYMNGGTIQATGEVITSNTGKQGLLIYRDYEDSVPSATFENLTIDGIGGNADSLGNGGGMLYIGKYVSLNGKKAALANINRTVDAIISVDGVNHYVLSDGTTVKTSAYDKNVHAAPVKAVYSGDVIIDELHVSDWAASDGVALYVTADGKTVNAAGESIELGGNTVINNAKINTADQTVNGVFSNGVYQSGGKLILNHAEFGTTNKNAVSIEGGQANLSNVKLNGTVTTCSTLYIKKGASLVGMNITIDKGQSPALANYGTADITNLTVTNTVLNHAIMNEGADAVLTIRGAHIGSSSSRNFALKGGIVNLYDVVIMDAEGGSNDAFCFYSSTELNIYGDLTIQNYTGDGMEIAAAASDSKINVYGSVSIHNVTGHGLNIQSGAFTVYDQGKLTISDTDGVGLYTTGGAVTNVENVTISNTGSYGIQLGKGTFTGKNITVDGAKNENGSIGAGTDANGTFENLAITNGAAPNDIDMWTSAKILVKNSVLNKPVRVKGAASQLRVAESIQASVVFFDKTNLNVIGALSADSKLVLDWDSVSHLPTDRVAVEFLTAEGEKDTAAWTDCKDNLSKIALAVNTAAAYDLFYYEADAAIWLAPKFVTNETDLGIFLRIAELKGEKDVIVPIAGSFEVASQVNLADSFDSVTFRPYDTGDYTITYTGSAEGLFIIDANDKLILQDLSFASTKNILLKQAGGELIVADCVLSGATKNMVQTAGKATIKDSTLNQTSSNNIQTLGELNLEGQISIAGPNASNSTHGLYIQGGTANMIGTVSITGTTGDAMQVSGGANVAISGVVHINGGGRNGVMLCGGSKLTVNGVLNIANTKGAAISIDHWKNDAKTSSVTVANGGKIHIGADADGNGIANHGIVIQNIGELTVEVGGKLTIRDVSGTNVHGISMANGTLKVYGEIEIDGVTGGGYGANISGNSVITSVKDGALVETGKLTIKNVGYGIAFHGNAVAELAELVCENNSKSCLYVDGANNQVTVHKANLGGGTTVAETNVNIKKGTVTVTNATLNKTKNANVSLADGTLTLNDVVIKGSNTGNGVAVSKPATLKGDHITIESTKGIGLSNVGVTNVSNLTITGVGSHAIMNDGTAAELTVTGATIGGSTGNNRLIALKNGSTTTLKGDVTIDASGASSNDAICFYGGNATLNVEGNVVIRNISNHGIHANGTHASTPGKNDKVNITGTLTIEKVTGNAILLDAENSAVTVAQGGKLIIRETGKNGIEISKGTLTANGELTITNVTGNGINQTGGTVNIAGEAVITMPAAEKIGILLTDGEMNITGRISGVGYLINQQGGALNLTGATVSGSQKNMIQDGGTAVITDTTFHKTVSNNITATKGTMTLNGNVFVTGGTKDGGTHAFYINGGAVTANGTVTISDTTGAGVRIANGSFTSAAASTVNITGCNHGIQPNGGTVTINGALNATDLKGSGINMYTAGTVNINGTMTVTNTGAHGIQMTEGTVNVASGAKLTIQNVTGNGIQQSGGTFHANGTVQIDTCKTYTSDGKKQGGNGVMISKGTLNVAGALSIENVAVNGIELSGGEVKVDGSATVRNAANRGINVGASAKLNGSNIGIYSCNLGLTNYGATEIHDLTIADTVKDHSIMNEGAAASLTIHGAAIGKSSGRNIALKGGTVNLYGTITINPNGGSNDAFCFYTSTTLNIHGNVTVQNVKGDGMEIYAAATDTDIHVYGSLTVRSVTERGIYQLAGTLTIHENGKLIIDDPTGHGIESNAKVELKSGAQLVIDKANYGIRMNGSGEFVSQTDSSVEINGSGYPVVAHGNSGITIGKLIATGTANSNIYVDTTGTVTIANATVTGGKQGVEMLKGTLNLSNTSFDKPAKIVANGKEKVLNLSGLIKGSILFNEAIPANVTGALTDGSDVTVDWAASKAPADGIAINFAAGTMEASKKYIKLGSVQSATYLLHFTTEGGAEVGKLVDNIVKTEAELNEYFAAATYYGITEPTILIGDSFAVTGQVAIPAGITSLSIQGEGKTITYNGSNGSIFAWNNCKALSLNDITIDGNQKGQLAVPAGITANLTDVTILKPYQRGVQFNGAVHMSGTITVDNAGGNTDVWAVSGADNGVLTCDAGTTLNINNTQFGFVANGSAVMSVDTVVIKDISNDAIYKNGSGTMTIGTAIVEKNTTAKSARYGVHMMNGKLTIGNLSIRDTGNTCINQTGGTSEFSNVTIQDHANSHSVKMTVGTMTIHGGTIGKSNSNNVRTEGTSVLNLFGNVTINGTKGNNALCITANSKLNIGSAEKVCNLTVNNANQAAIAVNHDTTGKAGVVSAAGSTVTVNNAKYGIHAASEAQIQLSNMVTNGVTDKSIYALGKANVTILSGTFGTTQGAMNIETQGSASLSLSNATIVSTSTATWTHGNDKINTPVHIYSSGSASLDNVTITGGIFGIRVHTCKNVTLNDVEIRNAASHGIFMQNSPTVKVTGQLKIVNAGSRGIQVNSGTFDGSNADKIEIIDPSSVGIENGGTVTTNNLSITTTKQTPTYSHNIKSSGKVTLNGTTILGRTNTNNVRIEKNGTLNMNGVVTIEGTNTNNGIASLGTVNLSGEVTIQNVAADDIIIWEGGALNVAGKLVAGIRFDTAVALNVTGALTDGSDVTVDWAAGKAPTGDAITFKDAATLNESKRFITLGSVQAVDHVLIYENTAATLRKLDGIITNDAQLQAVLAELKTNPATVVYKLTGDIELATARIDVLAGTNLTLIADAADGDQITISRGAYTGVMATVRDGASLTILTADGTVDNRELVFVGTSGQAKMITVEGSGKLVLGEGIELSGNTHNSTGQAIYSNSETSAQITVIGVYFANNTGSAGGAIRIDKAGTKLIILDSKFIGNKATTGFGGAISINGGIQATIDGCLFQNNTSKSASGSQGGGALMFQGGPTVTVSNCQFIGNKSDMTNADSGGGAIRHNSGTLTVTNSSFTGNTAGKRGGAIYNAGTLIVKESEFTGNVNTGDHGGAIYTSGALTVTNSSFTENKTTSNGGAIELNGAKTMTITGSSFHGNTATEGGALMMQSSPSVTIDGCIFTQNHATNGGAIKNNSSTNSLVIKSSRFEGNTAKTKGGALYQQDGKRADVTNSSFTGNTAGTEGNAVYGSGTVYLTGCTILNADCAGKFSIVKE